MEQLSQPHWEKLIPCVCIWAFSAWPAQTRAGAKPVRLILLIKADPWELCKTSCGWGRPVRSDFCTVFKSACGLWPAVTQEALHATSVLASTTSAALSPQVPSSTALVPLSTAQRPRDAVHCYFNTHRHTALLCIKSCNKNTRACGVHCTLCRSAAVQTNFSVDDLAGKGVQCACHMQGKQQSRNQKSWLLHIVRCRQVPRNYELLHCTALIQNCYTALRLPLLKYPFLAIFLLAHIQVWGDMLMRGQYKKELRWTEFIWTWFHFCRFSICSR